MSRVPNQASVTLNKNTNLENFEHCSTRVSIQLRVQRNSYEQKMLFEQKMQTSITNVPIYSGRQLK